MASTASQENKRQLYIDLNKVCATQDFDRALKASNKILQDYPDEFKALHCKIICLVQLEKFEDGLHQLRKYSSISGSLLFEKAYCEYRLNRIAEALQTLNSVEDEDYRCMELKAQILFRQEEFSQAMQLYKRIMKDSDDDYGEERQTNFSAVLSALRASGDTKVESTGLAENTYELCYNAACFLVARGDWEAAAQKLNTAVSLCEEMFADEEDKSDLEEELAPLRVQLGYVMQMMGRHEEAMKLYQTVVKHKSSDSAVMAVASNNIICLNKDQNVFDSKKRLKVATADGLKQKLNRVQRECIAVNQCLLYLYTNQGEMCRRTASALELSQPHSAKPALIRAAQLLRDKKPVDAQNYLREFCARSENSQVVVEARLALVQLLLQQGSTGAACTELGLLPAGLRHRPGVVAALVTLYKSQEDMEGACDTLDVALEECTTEWEMLARRAAQLNLRAGNAPRAAELLEALREENPREERLLAQLVHAYSQFDTKRAEDVSRQLDTSQDVLDANLDVDALETGFFGFGSRYKQRAVRSPSSQTPAAAAAAAAESDAVGKKRKKKKKPGKMPKNLDSPIDPERWLPRRERSYYRGKKRDKRRAQDYLRGPQGATASAGGDLDLAAKLEAKTRAEPPSSSPAAATLAAEGPRQQKPQASKQQKKKRKGARW